MKRKLLCVTLLILMVACVLASCGSSMEDYKENLGSDYTKETMTSDDEIEEMAETFDLEPSDYDVQEITYAIHKRSSRAVVIIECGSDEDAEALVDDSDDIIEMLENSYSSRFTFKAECEGPFVFIGEASAIADALGE